MTTATAERRRVYPGSDQVALRATVLLGTLTSLVSAQAAGARPHLWVQALLLVFALVLATQPESALGTALLVGLAYVWSTVGDPLSPLVLVMAAGMVLVHVAPLVAAQGPRTMAVDRTQTSRWARRSVVLWLAAAAVWGMALLAVDLPGGRLAYATGLTVLMLGAATATRLILTRR